MIPPPIADSMSFPQALAGGDREQIESVLFDITSDIKLSQHPWVEDMVPALATVFLAVREGPSGLPPALAESLMRLPNFIRTARRLMYAGPEGAAVRSALLQVPALKSEHIEVMAPLPVTAEAAWAIFAAPVLEELDRRVVFKRAGIRAKRAAREAGEAPVWKRSRPGDDEAWVDGRASGESGQAPNLASPEAPAVSAALGAEAAQSGPSIEAGAEAHSFAPPSPPSSEATQPPAAQSEAAPIQREPRSWPVSPWILMALGGAAMSGCTAAGALAAWAWLSVPETAAPPLAPHAQQIRNAAPLALAEPPSDSSSPAQLSGGQDAPGARGPNPREASESAETLREVQRAAQATPSAEAEQGQGAETASDEPLPPARFSRRRSAPALPLEAASAGEPAAQRKLGAHYFLGLDRVRDPVLALAWFELAARRDPESARLRDKIARLLGPEASQEARRIADTWREGQLLERDSIADQPLKPETTAGASAA